jgi:CRP/FNR family cyclic AMP-dependent transcriptional regulator
MPGTFDPSSLATIPLFDGLTSEELIRLNRLLHRTTLPAGRPLMTADQPGEVAYIILSGTVKVHVEQANGADVILGIRGPGEILGELSLLDNASRSATVVTLEEARLLWIDRLAFQECLKTMPSLAYNLLGILARRLRLATVQIQVLATQDLYGRVAYQLLAFADAYGETRPNGDVLIRLALKQSDLASLVGASRARVNQVLGFYKQRSYISVDQDTHITVHNRAALDQRCQ